MSGWVSVTGPPAAICCSKAGTTEPDEPNTLPKRTMQKRVWQPVSAAKACKTSSAMRLLAPMVLVGRTALSVEIKTKVATPHSCAARAQASVPKTLLRMPSIVLSATKGTCL